jgi:hypothetical protein
VLLPTALSIPPLAITRLLLLLLLLLLRSLPDADKLETILLARLSATNDLQKVGRNFAWWTHISFHFTSFHFYVISYSFQALPDALALAVPLGSLPWINPKRNSQSSGPRAAQKRPCLAVSRWSGAGERSEERVIHHLPCGLQWRVKYRM